MSFNMTEKHIEIKGAHRNKLEFKVAPNEVASSCVAPGKITVLVDTKCSKCNSNVRNGILCDICDKWSHFKCSNVTEDNITDEDVVMICPACETKLDEQHRRHLQK